MKLPPELGFLLSFVRRPREVGALAPSSVRLARAMVEWIEWAGVETVLEYGPGTGSFTGAILNSKRPGARLFAFERQPRFVRQVRDRFPEVTVFEESVANVRAVCDREGIRRVEAIISGLPWASFREAEQRQFIEAALSVLGPRGQFVTFAYLQGALLPAGRRFRRLLEGRFATVATSQVVWMNLPPAFVYRCRV